MDMQYASVALELKRAPDETGVFEGYASVFNVVDLGRDSVQPGAFSKSLGRRRVKMLWEHRREKMIGKWESIKEDEKGLFVRGRLFKGIPEADRARILMMEGELDSMSIGYIPTQAAPDENNRSVRKLIEVELMEISVVSFPMLPDAKITAVKSITTEREFERFLRDAGFSRKDAAAIALRGYAKAMTGQRDAGSDEPDTGSLKALISSLGQLKETFNVR